MPGAADPMRAIRDPLVALLCILGVFLAGAAPAAAGPYEDALAGFASDSFADTGAALAQVAKTARAALARKVMRRVILGCPHPKTCC